MKRKICIVTGSRAEYGLLYWLMKGVEQDRTLKLQLVCAGMHLSPEFGLTYRQIEKDGFVIDARIDCLLSSDSKSGVAKSIGIATIGFADAFQLLKPDIVVLLGDRFEILAAASAAMACGIPIAHIHGGELTEGVIDDQIRHAITKMSHLHFVATEAYRRRVVQLGEQPDAVFNVGAPGLENIRRLRLLKKTELAKQLDSELDRPVLLITFHPVEFDEIPVERQYENLLEVLGEFQNYMLVFTAANADSGGRRLNTMTRDFVAKNADRAHFFESLGQLRYLSLMKQARAVVGNSSSGLIEAPSLKVPTVNIGARQKNRILAASVISCNSSKGEIKKALNRALSPSFRKTLSRVRNPYGSGPVSKLIIRELKKFRLGGLAARKIFYDLKLK